MDFKNRFVSSLSDDGIIASEDKEIYEFGLSQLISIVIDSLVALAIGFFMNAVLEMAVFVVTFATIRRYAGGYHADKRNRCILLSALMEITVILAIYNYQDKLLFLTILSVMGIFVLSPVDTENLLLDCIQKQVYKKKAILSTIFWAILFFIFRYFNMPIFYKAISVGIICSSILLIAGWIKADLIIHKKYLNNHK